MTISLWLVVLLVSGGVCLAAGVQHLLVGLGRRHSRQHLWFGIWALSVTTYTFLAPLTYGATSIAAYAAGLRWQMAVGAVTSMALAWYITSFAGLGVRWPAWLMTAAAGIWLAVNAVSPSSIVFASIDRLERLELPYGEGIMLAAGPPNRWRLLTDLSGLGFAALVIAGCVALARRGEARRALLLGGIFGAYLVVAGIVSPLIDLGLVRAPYLGTLALLAAVVTMGAVLSRDVVRDSVVADDVVARERLWRTLLEDVELLVIGVDREGRLVYANRQVEKVSGYSREEALGRPFDAWGVHRDREAVRASFARALAGEPLPVVAASFVTRSGEERLVTWSTVVIRDAEGGFDTALAIGADVTERRDAERARDQLVRELQALRQHLEDENLLLRREVASAHGFTGLVGASEALEEVVRNVERVAPADTTVLVMGETGTGKELVARAIHDASPRAGRPFITVNCGALPANLIESELFGHERGAFTGATARRKGRFEIAHGGTVFLDEVGELPLELQPKLLRVLQSGEVEPLGGTRQLMVDVRVVAATNRDLAAEVQAGRFREDLFFRLHVFPIMIPPLRQRVEDIPLLVEHFVPILAANLGAAVDEVPGAVLREMQGYHWPGNVRELIAVLERAIITSGSGPLRLADRLVPRAPPGPRLATGHPGLPEASPLATLEEVERAHVVRVLRAAGGRVEGAGGAAEILGLRPSTLRSRMKRLRIRP